jgi:hypothetical protein
VALSRRLPQALAPRLANKGTTTTSMDPRTHVNLYPSTHEFTSKKATTTTHPTTTIFHIGITQNFRTNTGSGHDRTGQNGLKLAKAVNYSIGWEEFSELSIYPLTGFFLWGNLFPVTFGFSLLVFVGLLSWAILDSGAGVVGTGRRGLWCSFCTFFSSWTDNDKHERNSFVCMNNSLLSFSL